MAYEVEFLPSASRELRALPPVARERVLRRIMALEENPRPVGAIQLHSAAGSMRVRVGDYRVIYAVQDDARQIIIEKVAHRREVYRRRA